MSFKICKVVIFENKIKQPSLFHTAPLFKTGLQMFFIYSQRDELNLPKNKNITFCYLDKLRKDTLLKFKSCHNNKKHKIKQITGIFKNYGINNINPCSFNQYNFSTHLTTCFLVMSLNSQTIPVCY